MSEQLNASELGRLRRFIASYLPQPLLRGPNPAPEKPLSIEPLVEASISRGRLRTISVNDNPAVIAKLKSAGLGHLVPGQVYSLGIGPDKILIYSCAALRTEVAQAQARADEECPAPRPPILSVEAIAPAPPRRRFIEIGN